MTLRPDDPLKALGAKIDAVREARKPKPAPRGANTPPPVMAGA